MNTMHRLKVVGFLALLLAVTWCGSWRSDSEQALAAEGTEYVGIVLSIDMSSGKFAVKKDGGGSRFTFVANEKTHFEGGAKAVKDLKKGDHVSVLYQMQGSQYVALNVTIRN
ncbi:MAG: hypothetical protein K0S58_2007 [Nitrospira sp.]|nr:hypothetical protein [Nitrospira sp.]